MLCKFQSFLNMRIEKNLELLVTQNDLVREIKKWCNEIALYLKVQENKESCISRRNDMVKCCVSSNHS